MSDTTSALDDAFDRMAASDFELPNGFVNHGPMACEALAALGRHDEIDGWSRWFTQMVGDGPRPTPPRGTDSFARGDALGDYRRLPEWIGYFERVIADDGWAAVVALWIPRLSPGMATVLFHGVIRTAHAVRAIDGMDTPSRRSELARSLGYWSARFQPGPAPEDGGPESSVGSTLVEAAAHGARQYVIHPSIFNLHGVTGAMAADLLVPHIAPEAAARALRQIRADLGALYGAAAPGPAAGAPVAWDDGIAGRVADSRNAHQVKLVEACRRGFVATGDDAFAAAAARVAQGN